MCAQQHAVKAVALSSVVGSFLAAGNANAAMEVAQLAASDNRLSILATLFLPAIGWVLFNIGAPRDIAECPPTHVNELHGDKHAADDILSWSL